MNIAGRAPLLSMSALSGLLALRRYSSAHPEISRESAIAALRRVSPDDGYHDYRLAFTLDELAGPIDHNDVPAFLRKTIASFIERNSPWWLRLAPYGRDRVRGALTTNEDQCLEAAGLFVTEPTEDILQWWDRLARHARTNQDAARLSRGRTAERLTIDYETDRLSRLGITNRPRWIAPDDNSAGYDVLSYDLGPAEPVAKLIEVKSCSADSQEIYLTRNEWETAIERAPNYRFQIWLLPEESLIELTPGELEEHIAQDRGHGRWENIRIALSYFPQHTSTASAAATRPESSAGISAEG